MPQRVFTYEFQGRFSNLTAGLAAGGRAVGDFGGKLVALDKNGAKMRAGLDQLGGTAGRVGLVAAAGLGAVIGATARFEKSMSAVRAATGETAENMDRLREAALQAGADTVYSATEAAGAIEELAKAGVSTADIVGGGLTGALNLAAAGALDVAKAAEISATAMTQFGLGGEDVEHIADLLAAGAGKAQGSVEDLGMALNQSGLVASQVGLSIEETVGALAQFASAGLVGSDAGTAFKTMLGALSPNSKEAATLMSELGISAYDAQGQFIGMTAFAGNLRDALSGMTDQQRQSTLETIFGSDAVRAAAVIYSDGAEGAKKWQTNVDDAGFASEQAAQRLDNLAGDVEKFMGSLETALIGAGSSSQGPLRELVQGATGAVDAFTDLPPAAQSTATALLAVTAVTGGAAWFGAKVINGVASTKEALDNLGVSAGRSRTALQGIGRGVQLIAIVEGVKLLDDALAGLTDARLEGNLNRNLEALANDEVVGNLDKMGGYVRSLNSSIAEGTDKFAGFLPGKTEFSQAKDEIEKVDEALASMVESGNGDLAADIFEKIAEQSKEQGIGLAETTKVFGEYGKALRNAGPEADDAAAATKGLTDATGELGSVMGPTAATSAEFIEQQKAAADQLKESREAALDTATGFANLGDSLNDSKVSLGDWIGQLEQQAEALRNFRQNAIDAAENGINKGLIRALQKAGPEGAMRLAQLADASESEARRANRAYRSQQSEINKYVDAVGTIPGAKSTALSVTGADTAIAALNRIRDYVIPDKTFKVTQTTNARLADAKVTGGTKKAPDSARGNIFAGTRAFSLGDVVDAHEPEFAGPGPIRMWREPETRGESYIPHADDSRRPRAKAILERTVDMFGGEVQWYARGGSTAKPKRGRRGVDILVDGDNPLVGRDRVTIKDLKDVTRGANKALRALEASVDASKGAVDASKDAHDEATRALQTETGERERLGGLFASLSDSVESLFRSELFDTSAGSVWTSMRSTADPIATLTADIAASEQYGQMFASLNDRFDAGGLSDDALTAAAGKGTDALATLAAYTDEELRTYSELFARREAQLGTTGAAVAQAQYGAEIARQDARLAEANALATAQLARLDQATAQLAALEAAQRSQEQAVAQAGRLQEQATREQTTRAKAAQRSKTRSRRNG